MSDAEQAARDAIAKAIQDFADLVASEYGAPYVNGWVVAFEYTSVELERDNHAGRQVVAPIEQMVSTSGGLAAYAQHRWI
jgi:hypothetical protein